MKQFPLIFAGADAPRLKVLQQLTKYKEPMSIYKVARDMQAPTSWVYRHINKLMEEGAVVPSGTNKYGKDCYLLNPWLARWEEHLDLLLNLIKDAMASNPTFNPGQLIALIRYNFELVPVYEEETDGDAPEDALPNGSASHTVTSPRTVPSR